MLEQCEEWLNTQLTPSPGPALALQELREERAGAAATSQCHLQPWPCTDRALDPDFQGVLPTSAQAARAYKANISPVQITQYLFPPPSFSWQQISFPTSEKPAKAN